MDLIKKTTREKILEFANDNSELHRANTISLKEEILDELLEILHREFIQHVKEIITDEILPSEVLTSKTLVYRLDEIINK